MLRAVRSRTSNLGNQDRRELRCCWNGRGSGSARLQVYIRRIEGGIMEPRRGCCLLIRCAVLLERRMAARCAA